MMQLGQLNRCFAAKGDRQNQNRYLPLWIYAKDRGTGRCSR